MTSFKGLARIPPETIRQPFAFAFAIRKIHLIRGSIHLDWTETALED
jgi:hypothetical protein